jgi:methionyl aminopeptidase
VVHAPSIPSRVLREGDIVGIDIGMEYPSVKNKNKSNIKAVHGYYTDMAATAPVGRVSPLAQKLIDVTKKSLEIGMAQVKP